MSKLTTDLLSQLAQEALPPGRGLFLLDVRVSDSAVRPKARIVIDGDEGVDVEACADVSRRTNRRLEELLGEEASYLLEVTSPGVDQPISLPRQFPRHIGRELVVTRIDGTETTGTLQNVTPDGLELTPPAVKRTKARPSAGAATPATTFVVPFAELKHALVVISFK